MRERVIALGFFDGVHLGHGALLRRTVEEAARRGCTPAVFTFDRPPKEVVTGLPCPLINSPEDRKDLIRDLSYMMRYRQQKPVKQMCYCVIPQDVCITRKT